MIRDELDRPWTIRGRGVAATLAIVASLTCLLVLGVASAEADTGTWKVVGITGPTNLPPATAEVQEVSVDAGAGTFTLTFESQTTAPLPFDATAAEVRAALAVLPPLAGEGAVAVTGGPGNPGAELPYFVSFRGPLAGVNVPPLSGAATSGAVSVATETEGNPVGSGELLAYATNVAATSASLPVKMTIGPLPAGIETAAAASGSGWTCAGGAHEATVTCERTAPVGGEQTANPVVVPLSISAAAEHSTVEISVEGGGQLQPGIYTEPVTVSQTPAPPGLAAFWAGAFDEQGEAEVQAGGHPYIAQTFLLRNTVLAADGRVIPAGDLRDSVAQLPPGFLGDPLVTPRCPQSALGPPHSNLTEPCGEVTHSEEAVIGRLVPLTSTFEVNTEGFSNPIFNNVPPQGYAAEFTGKIGIPYQSFLASVRSSEDFGATISAPNASNIQKIYGAIVSLEGMPAAAGGQAFLRNPTDCALQAASSPFVALATNTWQSSAFPEPSVSPQPPVTGCQPLTESWRGEGPEPKKPSFEFQPTVTQGSSGTGATAHLHINQEGLTDPGKPATSDLKKTVVSLPAGLSLNPAAANGLESCSEAQIGFKGTGFPLPNPIRFDEEPPACPDGSKLGTVEATSPLLEEPVTGTIYLAAQEENPFHGLLALYLVIESPKFGLTVKLPGEVTPDPNTGQLTATFDNNPQLPVEDLTLHFRGGGPRSELATPEVCGHYKTTGSLTPWSAEHGEAAQIDEAGFSVSAGCSSSAEARPFAPSFEAGTMSTAAGAYSPLIIKLARKDGEQELTHLEFTLPPGLTGKLAGIPYCSDGAIAAAKGKTGKAEQASPSCPAAAELGSVDTSAGVGSEPIHVGGHVYLAGPYEGAPVSTVVITPAVAGPFDLGTVVVRAPLFVNPETARITAKSDEIPHILKGIPLQLRSVEIKVTRDGFTLNPTSCNPMTVSSSLSGLNGGTASPASRFQVGGCQALPFKPQLKLSVLGETNRNAKPRFKAVLTTKPGEANISRAQVNLPHSEFLEQGHIKTVCTRVQFAAGDGNGSACPADSVYGHAKAWSPLLDKPLEGPVYLRANGGERELPDLVAALSGQINVALWGKVDSGANAGIRNTFEVVPDAPVSRFVLEMSGGGKGLLVNSEDLCSKQAKRTAIVRFTGQNGKVHNFKPTVANSCKKKGKRAAEKSSGRHAAKRSQAQVASLLRRLHTGW